MRPFRYDVDSCAHRQPAHLETFENVVAVARLNHDVRPHGLVSTVLPDVVVDPIDRRLSQWAQQAQRPVILEIEINRSRGRYVECFLRRMGVAGVIWHRFSPGSERKPPGELNLGERLRWVFALKAASLQILEAGTVAFFLARLPGRELNTRS